MARPPAPEIDHPYVFSVSQIETFQLCPRKWAFEKIDGLERTENKFAALGGRVHDVFEDYLADGKPIDTDTVEGRIAKPAIKHLPFPKTPGMRVEKWFSIVFGVAAYRGLKDVEILRGRQAAGTLPAGFRPLVLDHKTTRSWNWRKTKQELLRDTQAGIYAADAMYKTGALEVDLRWVYSKTEGKPTSEPVDAVINRAQVSAILTRTNETAKRMINVIQSCNQAMDVTPDFRGCSAYGGCGFREKVCKPKPVHILKAIMVQKTKEEQRSKGKTDTSDFLAQLAARKQKKAGATKAKDPEPIDVDGVEAADQINSPDRADFEQPAPPPAKKINGKYVNAEWDDDDAEWKFPEGTDKGTDKAEKAAAAAAKKAAAKGPSSKQSAKDILAASGKGKKAAQVERIEEEEVEEVEEEAEEAEEISLLDEIMDLFADKVAERLAARNRK